ncbi:hypothetical protein ACP275_13G093500 [Erythranthe tilingii]
MAKLAISAALFAALVFVASATTYTTTVVTTTVEEAENPREQSCQTEIQKMPMSHCMQWMQSQMGGKSSYGGGDAFIRSAVANPRYQEEEHLEECCSEMKKVSSPCRCEAMSHMMRQMQQQYGTEEEMQQMMKKKMQSLPKMCGMSSSTQCRFRAVFV